MHRCQAPWALWQGTLLRQPLLHKQLTRALQTSLALKQGLQGQRERLVREVIKPADLERFVGLLVSNRPFKGTTGRCHPPIWMHDPTTHSLGNLMTVFVDDLFTMQADVFLGLDIMLRLAQTIQACG